MFSKKKLRNQNQANSDPLQNKKIDINERFIYACENGDYPTVKRILLSIKDFSIDVTDSLGRTALRLAVENEHLEVVQVLFEKADSAKMREALLLSIFLGHEHIAESILKHPKYKILNDKKFLNGDSDSFWSTPSSDDAQFSPDITPLILAAQYNRTEIVQMLLIKGDRIVKPHDFDCKCTECHNRFKFDSLRHAQSRLNSYRGLASESYISLVSVDPIMTAFELGHELRLLSTKEKFFKNEYLQLVSKLSNYTMKLLSNVRGRDELEIVLNKTGKETEEKYERLARLDLAVKYREKPFVAHPNCQQKLTEIWYTGLRPVSKMPSYLVMLLLFGFLVFSPFLLVAYMFAPKSKITKFMSNPCVKFVSHSLSYIVFIIIIVISSTKFADFESSTQKFSSIFPKYTSNMTDYVNRSDLGYRYFNNDFYLRPSAPGYLDVILTIWIVGFIWHEFKQLWSDGLRDYFMSTNNMFDLTMIVFYAASYALKFYTIFLVRSHLNDINSDQFWSLLTYMKGNDTATQKNIFTTFYWLNEDRFYWLSFDPIFLSETLFAIGNIFSLCRFCFLLPANQSVGPLQITLGIMMGDVIKFLVIFGIIFVAFMIGINNLYWYFLSSVRQNVEVINHPITNAEQYFGTIYTTFQTMFWSLFGLGNQTNILLEPFENKFTETIGFLLYGLFHIATIIILLNMLIAMMAKSYERILAAADIEWKFARSQLYMEYIKKGATLPPPFNIIPTPKSFFYIVYKPIVSFIKHTKDGNEPNQGDKFEENSIRPISKKTCKDNELTYKIVMQRIVKRYLLHNQRESDGFEKEFQELKQDLQMIRYEMMNDMKRTKDDTMHSQHLIQLGLNIIGEELFSRSNNENNVNLSRFNEFKYFCQDLTEKDEDLDAVLAADESPEGDKVKTMLEHTANLEKKKADFKNFNKKTFFDVVNTAIVVKRVIDDTTNNMLTTSSEGSLTDLTGTHKTAVGGNRQISLSEVDTIQNVAPITEVSSNGASTTKNTME